MKITEDVFYEKYQNPRNGEVYYRISITVDVGDGDVLTAFEEVHEDQYCRLTPEQKMRLYYFMAKEVSRLVQDRIQERLKGNTSEWEKQ